jgi:glycosyltransferase involved in cell wall biosynthesis
MAAEVVSDTVPRQAKPAGQAVGERSEDSGHDRTRLIGTTANGYAPKPALTSIAPDASRRLTLSIIMAAYNEEDTIARAVQEILTSEFPCDIELIVVNDGSTDRTADLLGEVTDPRVTVFHHDQNRGKGAALRSAAALASGNYVLPFDADLEYVVEDVMRMLEPVVKGRCEVVYGVRLFGYNTVYRSYRYAMGNKMLTRITNVLFDACLSDLHTCLKLMPTDLLRGIELKESGFGLDTEITASLLRIGVRPFEVPVSYFGRSHAEGKKITWRDAVACIWILLRVRLSRRSALIAERCGAGRGRDARIAPGGTLTDEVDGEFMHVVG